MKKFAPFLAFVLLLAACSIDEEPNTTFTYELVPVDSVSIPNVLVYNQSYTFEITYKRPSTCHAFAGYDYQKDGNDRTIGVINTVYDKPSCEELIDMTAISELNFIVKRKDFYVFKFWQGETANGEPKFLSDTIPVNLE